MLGLATLGTGIDPPADEDSSPARRYRVQPAISGTTSGKAAA